MDSTFILVFLLSYEIVMWDRGLRVRNITFINFPSNRTQAIYGPVIAGRCTTGCGGINSISILI